MRRIQPDESCPSTREEQGAAAGQRVPAASASSWAPGRRAMIPVALPKRFVDGVAWDEV
ncbi:MAG: hypothetical protein ABI629_15820 [bacterium]